MCSYRAGRGNSLVTVFSCLPGSSQLLSLLHWTHSVVFVCSFIRKPISLNPCGVDRALKSLVNSARTQGEYGWICPCELKEKGDQLQGLPQSQSPRMSWFKNGREAAQQRSWRQWLWTVRRWTAAQTAQAVLVTVTVHSCRASAKHLPRANFTVSFHSLRSASVPAAATISATHSTGGFGYWVVLM